MVSFYSPELMLHYLKKSKPIDILNIITTYFWTSGCASLNSSVKLFPYMTPLLMCIQLSALFPTQVGVYFCRRLDSKRKTHTKNLILHIPHLITPFSTQGRCRTWIYHDTSSFYGNDSHRSCPPKQAGDNSDGSRAREANRDETSVFVAPSM